MNKMTLWALGGTNVVNFSLIKWFDLEIVTLFSVSPESVSLVNRVWEFDRASNQSQDLEVTCDGAWTIESNVPWLIFSQTSGSGNATVTVQPLQLEQHLPMSANFTSLIRQGNYSATITVSSGETEVEVPLVLMIGFGTATGVLENQ